MIKKQYFTEEEAVESIIAVLEDYSGYYADLHNETFNTDYYIIGTFEAKQALEQYGVFDAIGKVADYLRDELGETADSNLLANPENLANMLSYIVGQDAMMNSEFYAILEEAEEDLEKDDLWNSEATPEVNQYIINKLQDYLQA